MAVTPIKYSAIRTPGVVVITLAVIGFAVEALTPTQIVRIGGWTPSAVTSHYLPTISLVTGLAILGAATWCASEWLRRSPLPRAGGIVLGLLTTAQFGSVYLAVLQLAVEHDFYRPSRTPAPPSVVDASRYWGLVLFALASVAYLGPLTVVAANMLPVSFGPRRYRELVRVHASRTWWAVWPFGASLLIITINAILPQSVRVMLGYSAPGPTITRYVYPSTSLNAAVWLSTARLAFLPVAVGMWEGLESARAARHLAIHLPSAPKTVKGRPVVLANVVLTVVAGVIAVRVHDVELLLVGVCLPLLIIVSVSGIDRRFLGTPTLHKWAKDRHLGEHAENVTLVSVLLAVLAAPVITPLGYDLWHAFIAPWRILLGRLSYSDFWTQPAILHVPSVTLNGVFGNGEGVIVKYSLGLAILIVFGVVFNTVFRIDDSKGIGTVIFFALRVALVAFMLSVVVRSATSPLSVVTLCLGALPVLSGLLTFADSTQTARIATHYLVAVGLLVAWATIVWHYTLFPAWAVLALLLFWRLIINARELNAPGSLGVRRFYFYLAIVLVGLGLLLLDHGTPPEVLATNEFIDITDRIGVAVVAPIWLIVDFLGTVAAIESPKVATEAASETASAGSA